MQITLIAAISDNHALGKDNALAWNMPADRQFFMEQIKDKVVVMGRRTYDSHLEEEAIPYAQAIVVTRRADYQAPGAHIFHSLAEAYTWGLEQKLPELMILGGGQIYAQAIEDADRLVITEIHTEIEGDAFFPSIDLQRWKELSRQSFPADEENAFAYEFVRYQRQH
ncbi:MAG: dihydrofolate reductase [Bacteroidota bacterium]